MPARYCSTKTWFTIAALLTLHGAASQTTAQIDAAQKALNASVSELRHVIGEWSVVTEFLNPDGTVARTTNGTYTFDWVVPDRVLAGRSEMPELKMSSGILFYVNEARQVIEMVSVGRDGVLWIMTGPLGGDARHTPVYKTDEGRDSQLRFTRFNVTADRFESRMELTDDGGKTWRPGNHQVFQRKGMPEPSR
jgi:hypothetical protein